MKLQSSQCQKYTNDLNKANLGYHTTLEMWTCFVIKVPYNGNDKCFPNVNYSMADPTLVWIPKNIELGYIHFRTN